MGDFSLKESILTSRSGWPVGGWTSQSYPLRILLFEEAESSNHRKSEVNFKFLEEFGNVPILSWNKNKRVWKRELLDIFGFDDCRAICAIVLAFGGGLEIYYLTLFDASKSSDHHHLFDGFGRIKSRIYGLSLQLTSKAPENQQMKVLIYGTLRPFS